MVSSSKHLAAPWPDRLAPDSKTLRSMDGMSKQGRIVLCRIHKRDIWLIVVERFHEGGICCTCWEGHVLSRGPTTANMLFTIRLYRGQPRPLAKPEVGFFATVAYAFGCSSWLPSRWVRGLGIADGRNCRINITCASRHSLPFRSMRYLAMRKRFLYGWEYLGMTNVVSTLRWESS